MQAKAKAFGSPATALSMTPLLPKAKKTENNACPTCAAVKRAIAGMRFFMRLKIQKKGLFFTYGASCKESRCLFAKNGANVCCDTKGGNTVGKEIPQQNAFFHLG